MRDKIFFFFFCRRLDSNEKAAVMIELENKRTKME